MKSERNIWVPILMIVLLLGSSAATCFWPSESQEIEFTLTGEVTGISSWNQPLTDIKVDEVYEYGVGLGSTFTVDIGDLTLTDAILMTNYLGAFVFDMMVNIESDGYLSIVCMGQRLNIDAGEDVTLTYTGPSERYEKTPHYNVNYTSKRADYPSDEVFANFYEVTGGDLKPGILYRSFSPLNTPDKQSRSAYVSELAEEAGIQFDIALSYSDATVQKACETVEGYIVDLCKEGKYVAPNMNYSYFQEKEKTIIVLESILDNDGAYLIHCNVGRDRTGYVVLLLQALCGCTPDEMKECEARAFCNLHHIVHGSEEYRTVVDCTYTRNMYFIANPDKISEILYVDWSEVSVDGVDTYTAAYEYCTEYLGMSDERVMELRDKLCD